jgi:hypothetical protein
METPVKQKTGMDCSNSQNQFTATAHPGSTKNPRQRSRPFIA